MTEQERQQSYARRDELRAIDHETLQAIRRWLAWACTSGLVAIVGVVWFLAQLDARMSSVEASMRTTISQYEARIRAVEGSERTIQATLTNQAQTLRDIRDDQRAMRDLLDRYFRAPAP